MAQLQSKIFSKCCIILMILPLSLCFIMSLNLILCHSFSIGFPFPFLFRFPPPTFCQLLVPSLEIQWLCYKHWRIVDSKTLIDQRPGEITSLHPSINHLPWSQPCLGPGFLFSNMKLSFRSLVLPFRRRGKMPRLLHSLAKDSFCLFLLIAPAVKKVRLWFPMTPDLVQQTRAFSRCFLLLECLACMFFSASLAPS